MPLRGLPEKTALSPLSVQTADKSIAGAPIVRAVTLLTIHVEQPRSPGHLHRPLTDWFFSRHHTHQSTQSREPYVNHDSARSRHVLTLAEATDPVTRNQVRDFIRKQFAFHFGADATIEPPVLIGVWNMQGELVGALGLRTAADGFFSQHYLAQPLDEVMSATLGVPIRDTDIVEVVHLAVAGPAIITPLLEQLADFLSDNSPGKRGFRYLVCTATRCLQRFFVRRGWSITTLAMAEPQALGADAAAWGEYYAQAPAVIVGNIGEARTLAHREPLRAHVARTTFATTTGVSAA